MTILIGFPAATIPNDMAECMRLDGESVSILHPDDFFAGNYNTQDKFIVTVVRDLDLRQRVIDTLDARGLGRATFVSSRALVIPNVVLEPGVFVGPFSSIFSYSHIGRDCIVSPYCMISHKVRLGENCLLHPSTSIAGTVTIGKRCTFGLRSAVLDLINICDDVYVGGASTVTKSIDKPGCYVGNPARRTIRDKDFLSIDTVKIK